MIKLNYNDALDLRLMMVVLHHNIERDLKQYQDLEIDQNYPILYRHKQDDLEKVIHLRKVLRDAFDLDRS